MILLLSSSWNGTFLVWLLNIVFKIKMLIKRLLLDELIVRRSCLGSSYGLRIIAGKLYP